MLVGDWMTRDPVTVPGTATLGQAAVIMARGRFRHLPVVDGDVLIGIVSRGDLLRASPPDVNPFSVDGGDAPALEGAVRLVMSQTPFTVAPDLPLESAAELLHINKIGAVPVVSGRGLVGILSDSDIFRAFAAAFGGHAAGLRLTFEALPGEDVLATALALGTRHGMKVVSATSMERQGQTIAVVRFVGPDSSGLVEALWDSGHRVVSVLRV